MNSALAFACSAARRRISLAGFLALSLIIGVGGLHAAPIVAPQAEQSHLALLGVDRWHAAGFRGKGVKVAILDSGFRGYRSHLGRGLPEQVTARSFRFDGNLEARDSEHGILCGEVVHALAPDAELLFANWEPDSSDQFVAAVRWARKNGAMVITCSVISPGWSDGEGGGTVHRELAKALDGAVFTACAGNVAERHWWGKFNPDRDGYHQWSRGNIANRLKPWSDERVTVTLSWQGKADFDLFVIDRDSGRRVVSSLATDRVVRHSAVCRFNPQAASSYAVEVRKANGEDVPFHCFALHSGLGESVSRGSVCFPADGPEVLAIGAVDRSGKRHGYSACGPNAICPKPDFVAPVPFFCPSRGKPFGGTSAAAPQAAGVGALLLSRHPDWKEADLRKALQAAARDLCTPGHDCETGYGMLRLPGK